MSPALLAFALLSALTLSGASGAVFLKNVSHALMSLVVFFFGIAGCFFMLRADFLGVVQVLVYVGAVAVLVVFAIVLTRAREGSSDLARLGGHWAVGMAAAVTAGVVVIGAILRSPGIDVVNPRGVGTAQDVGTAMMTTWVLPFEVASLLLTAALVGAVVIAIEELALSKKSDPSTRSERKP